MPQIFSLIRELAEFEHNLNMVSLGEKDLLRDGFGRNKLFHCLVAESGKEVIGAAVYFFNYSTWSGKCLYLEDLIVKRHERSSGAGTKLMSEIIAIAQAEKARRISWQVLDWNVDAHDFYLRFGATYEGEWLNGRLNEAAIRNFRGI